MKIICEKCGQSFMTIEECIEHEKKCCEKIQEKDHHLEPERAATKAAIDRLIEKYNLKTLDYKEPSIIGADDDEYSAVVFFYKVQLKNDTVINLDQALIHSGLTTEEKIFNELNNYIEKFLISEYTGKIIDGVSEDAWFVSTVFIGDTDIHDICTRLRGKNVRLSVVD